MDTLQQIPTDGTGMADLRELARVLLETMASAVMDAQADALCEDGANVRNGYRERGLKVVQAAMELADMGSRAA